MARTGIDYESSYGKARPSETIPKFQRTAPYYQRNRAQGCSFYIQGECTRGAECPYLHEMPITGNLSKQNIKDSYHGLKDPVALKLLNKAGESAGSSGPIAVDLLESVISQQYPLPHQSALLLPPPPTQQD